MLQSEFDELHAAIQEVRQRDHQVGQVLLRILHHLFSPATTTPDPVPAEGTTPAVEAKEEKKANGN